MYIRMFFLNIITDYKKILFCRNYHVPKSVKMKNTLVLYFLLNKYNATTPPIFHIVDENLYTNAIEAN